MVCDVLYQDDRYFLSGSLDGKLRLWNIPDKKVTLWNEVENGGLITTANFCHNGKFAVVGTYDGKCIFYSTEVRHPGLSGCSEDKEAAMVKCSNKNFVKFKVFFNKLPQIIIAWR